MKNLKIDTLLRVVLIGFFVSGLALYGGDKIEEINPGRSFNLIVLIPFSISLYMLVGILGHHGSQAYFKLKFAQNLKVNYLTSNGIGLTVFLFIYLIFINIVPFFTYQDSPFEFSWGLINLPIVGYLTWYDLTNRKKWKTTIANNG